MSTPSPPILLPEDSTMFPLATNSTIQFFWNSPLNDGGSPILGYQLYCPTPSITINTDSNTYTIIQSGLTNGTEYQFQIQASNANGLGSPSYFMSVQPGFESGPPSTMAASMISPTSALVQWTPTLNNGEATVKWYVITSESTNPADPVIALGANGYDRTRTVDTLNSNSIYSFLVQSVNDPGYSPFTTFTNTTDTISQIGLIFDFQPANFSNGTIPDSSSNGNILSNYNNPAQLLDACIYLRNDGYITNWYTTVSALSTFSLTILFKSFSTIGVDCALIGFNSNVSQSRLNILYSSSSNVYYGAIWQGSTYYSGIPVSLSLNTWYSMTVMYDGTNLITYLNETNMGSSNVGNYTINQDYFLISGNGPWGYPGPVGLVSEVYLYDRVLSPFEISWNYRHNNATIPQLNLLIWLDMADSTKYTVNSGNISTILDKSENGYILNEIPPDSSQGGTSILPVPGTPINGLSTAYFSAPAGIKMSTELDGITDFFWVGRQGDQSSFNAFLLGDDSNYDWSGGSSNYIEPLYSEPGIQNAPTTIFYTGISTPQLFVSTSVVAQSTIFMISAHGITGLTRFQGLCYDRIFSAGWIGDFGEMLCYNSNLSQKQIKNINSYLFQKWGFVDLFFTATVSGNVFYFSTDNNGLTDFVDFGDGTIITYAESPNNYNHVYSTSSNYTIKYYSVVGSSRTSITITADPDTSLTNIVYTNNTAALFQNLSYQSLSTIEQAVLTNIPDSILGISFINITNINNLSFANIKPNIYLLNLQNCSLTSVPILPNTVHYLYVPFNPVTYFTNIGPDILFISMYGCSLTSFPVLPQTVERVDAGNNNFTNLDNVNNPYYIDVDLKYSHITQPVAETMATNLSGIPSILGGYIHISSQQTTNIDITTPPFQSAMSNGWTFD